MDGVGRIHYSHLQSIWDREFCVRQTISYSAEDSRLQPEAGETFTESFLGFWSSSFDPPSLNFKALASFLKLGNLEDLKDRTRPATLTRLVLIDDRRDPCGLDEGQPGQAPQSNGQTRSWTSDQYARWPTSGSNKYRAALDERGLYDKLCEAVSIPVAFTLIPLSLMPLRGL